MAVRRTKKQKLHAKHQFAVSWAPTPERRLPKASVKGQIEKRESPSLGRGQRVNKAEVLAKEGDIEAYKHNTIKSLILASLILGLEVVLYLAWK